MSDRYGNGLALTGAVLLSVFLFGTIDYQVLPFSHWDLKAYLHMAEAAPALADDVFLPFASRLLGPMLAGLGPLPAPEMFRVLTLVAVLILPLLFFRFLTGQGLDKRFALTAVVLFVFNKHFFGFNIWNYFQLNDLLGMIFLVILFEAMLKGRWLVFGAFLFLGAMTRESTMIMIPVAALYLWEQGRLRVDLTRFLAAVGPGLILFLVMRLSLPAGKFGILETFQQYSAKAQAPRTWFYLFVNPVVPLSLVPVVFFRRTAAFFRTRRFALLFLGLVSLSAFFGSNNERLMAPTFIIFYWLICDILMGELRSGPTGGRIFLVACGFLAIFHQTYTRFPFLEKRLVVGLSMGSLLVVTVASILLVIWKRNEARSEMADL